MYLHLHPKACDSCGARPRKSEVFNRHCPSPDIVNSHLHHIAAEKSNLSASSIICISCYKYFQSILKQPIATSASCEPSDLDSVSTSLAQKVEYLRSKGQNISREEYFEMVLYQTAQILLAAMKSDEALLLSTLYNMYIGTIKAESQNYPSLILTPDIHTPRRRWVLSRLHALFGESLTIVCKHYKYGTLLFHSRCDLVKALSTALGKGAKYTRLQTDSSANESETSFRGESMHTQIRNVASHLNDRVHEQAKKVLVYYKDKPQRYQTFDLGSYIKMADPILLEFIQLLTQTVRTKRRLFGDETDVTQTKQIRQVFLLASVLFCTNVQCSMPMHTLVTEATICHGGTQELVKILNRIGVASSIDTSQRLATNVVRSRIIRGILPELNEHALSIVSIDNIDILQTHAFVSSTDGSRSWHGTSVQCVQPLPVTGILGQGELTQPARQRKHHASSPTASPVLVGKCKRRKRTISSPHSTFLNQGAHPLPSLDSGTLNTPNPSVSLEDFRPNPAETEAWDKMQEYVFMSMLLKHAAQNPGDLPNIQSLINCIRQQSSSTEESKVVYVEISSERADSRPTLISILGKMYKTFVVEQNQKWLVVVGDAKTYDIIKSIRTEYGEQMKWLIPWPGDWHILLNYQKAIMKAYADAGLVTLGEVTQHRSETLTSLIQCSNFRRTHNFLLQAMEAFYRYFLSLYLKQKDTPTLSPDQTINPLQELVSEFNSLSSDTELDTFREKVATAILRSSNVNIADFNKYMHTMCQKQDTIRFWYQFFNIDIMAYFGLYLAIRYRNWQLRNGSIKLLAAVFTAFDRPIYQQLVPRHILDILTSPTALLELLEKGGFSVRLTKNECHGVAFDECHEMKINKDAKMAVVRPSVTKMEYLSHYLPFQAACVNNFNQQLFPERAHHIKQFSHCPSSQDKKAAVNVERMLKAIADHGLFHDNEENSGLWNVFKMLKATNEQAHDLLNFRVIGQLGHEAYINAKLLNTPSTAAPVRRKRLCTFSSSQAEKRRIKQADKEAKMSQRYMKKTIAWLAENGPQGKDLGTLLGPPLVAPKALMDSEGLPYKGTKSTTTTYLERRYTTPSIISGDLPPSWTPHAAILEGMFMIQVSPLPIMSSMEEYVKLLLSRFVRPHFCAGVIEVHVVFDSPGTQKESPKEIEQRRRDKSASEVVGAHECIEFSGDLLVPEKWRSVLSCRNCKKNLILLATCYDLYPTVSVHISNLLSLGAHARGLLYLSCVYVCVSVCSRSGCFSVR